MPLPTSVKPNKNEDKKETKETKRETRFVKSYILSNEDLNVNEGERTVIATISTSDVDRDGEVVQPSKVNLENYQKNPTVLWRHGRTNTDNPVIGKNLWIKYDPSLDVLIAKTQFAETELANDIFKMFQDGFLKAFSIGFDSFGTAPRNPTKPELKDRPEWKGARVYDEIELWEYSAVPIGANPDALALAVSKGLLDEIPVKEKSDSELLSLDLNLDLLEPPVGSTVKEPEPVNMLKDIWLKGAVLPPQPRRQDWIKLIPKEHIDVKEIIRREIRRRQGQCF